jgi:hypothetical protein
VGGKGEGWGQGGEMTQALYAHVNEKTIKKRCVSMYKSFCLSPQSAGITGLRLQAQLSLKHFLDVFKVLKRCFFVALRCSHVIPLECVPVPKVPWSTAAICTRQ